MKQIRIDGLLLMAVMLLVGIGIVVIYSSSGPFAEARGWSPSLFLFSHVKKVVLGFAFLFAGAAIDHKYWMRYSRVLFIGSFLMLLFLLFSGNSITVHGAKRWISIGGFEFQPSEMVKISLMFLLASKLSEARDKIQNMKDGFIRPMTLVVVVFGIILAQPNYSTATSIMIISVIMLYAAGTQVKHLLLLGAAGLPAVGFLAISSPYRMKRVLALLSPDDNAASSYQQLQSLISLGNGGFFGTGLGQGTQKLGYLPMPFTDTIYAILGEELGFAGTFIVLALFGVIMWRGLVIAREANSRFGMLLAVALTTAMGINVFMHVGVCTRMLPATGQPLPLVSFGGTSLAMNLFAMGVLLNLSNPDSGRTVEEETLRRAAT
jgi:cell division protein FtsW